MGVWRLTLNVKRAGSAPAPGQAQEQWPPWTSRATVTLGCSRRKLHGGGHGRSGAGSASSQC
jgi:hypothetical protein